MEEPQGQDEEEIKRQLLSFYKKHAPSNSRDKATDKALKRSESRGDSKSKSRNQSFFNS